MVLGAALGFLGARADRKQRERELDAQKPGNIRKEFEAAGFNPLLGVGGALRGVGYAPTFGSSMMQAGNLLDAHFSEQRQLKLQKTELEQENRRLEILAKRATLSPRNGGIYAQNGTVSNGVSTVRDLGGGTRRAVRQSGEPQRETVHKFIRVWDPEVRRYYQILNPELTESGPAEIATGTAVLAAADAAQNPGQTTGKPLKTWDVETAPLRRKQDYDDDLEREKLKEQRRQYERVFGQTISGRPRRAGSSLVM